MVLGLFLRVSCICLFFGVGTCLPADVSDTESRPDSGSILQEHGEPNITSSSKTISSILANLESEESPTGNQSASSPEASSRDAGPPPTHEPDRMDANSDSNSNSTTDAAIAPPRSFFDGSLMGLGKKIIDLSMQPKSVPSAGSSGAASSSPWHRPFFLEATYTPYGHGGSDQDKFPLYGEGGYGQGGLPGYGHGVESHGGGGYPSYGHGASGYPGYGQGGGRDPSYGHKASAQEGHPSYSLGGSGHGDSGHPGYGLGGSGHGGHSGYGLGHKGHGGSGQGERPGSDQSRHSGYGLGGSGHRDGGYPSHSLGDSSHGGPSGYGLLGSGHPGSDQSRSSGYGLGGKGHWGSGQGGHPSSDQSRPSGYGLGGSGKGDGGYPGHSLGGSGQGGHPDGDQGRSSGAQEGLRGSGDSGHYDSGYGGSYPGRHSDHRSSGQGGPSGYGHWGRGSSLFPGGITLELVVLGNELTRFRQMPLTDAWRTAEVPKDMISKLPFNPLSHTVLFNGGYLRERDFRSDSKYAQNAYNHIHAPELQLESHPNVEPQVQRKF
ncbi:pro-resilin-like [Melanotaenia boesemani]|uniref:pro-resilin-like n=1 Tax=Melanotaenia boesemani TaxID=1250792 RepID=UPI001C043970|nr:pro-resilin-like [Melanotaenia boesemani]